MRLAILVGAIALALAWPTGAGGEETSEARVVAYFANLVQNPDELRAINETFGGPVSDAFWSIQTRHVLPILGERAYAAYVARRLPSLVSPDATEEALLRDFAMLGDVWALGLARLSPKRTATYYALALESIRWLRQTDADACATAPSYNVSPGDPGHGLLFATMSPERAAALREANQVQTAFLEANLDWVDRYFHLVAAAAWAEANATPAVRSLEDDVSARTALSAFNVARMNRLLSLPGADEAFGAIQAAAVTGTDLLANVSVEFQCEMAIADLEVALELPVRQREIVILAFATTVADPARVQRMMAP